MLNFFFNLLHFRLVMMADSGVFNSNSLPFDRMGHLHFVDADLVSMDFVFQVEYWANFAKVVVLSTSTNLQESPHFGLNQDNQR